MSRGQTAIACSLIRGGTSRGAYFVAADLPSDERTRDRVLVAIMGGPDELCVDGISGGHPLTSKVSVVAPSGRADADVEYRFLQVIPSEQRVSDTQNCGNLLAGVGPFAIDKGMVPVAGETTTVRVYMVNTDSLAELTVKTPSGAVTYDGDEAIDGVPGAAAPIVCDFAGIAGSSCGALLPTGNARDDIDGLEVTCIDHGMPVIVMRASDVGVSGYESAEELDGNDGLKAALERIRVRLGPAMNLGDVAEKTVPKLCLIAPPRNGGVLTTRTFIPHVCHRTIGVFGAISVASACVVSGSVAEDVARLPAGEEKRMLIEHPSGGLGVRLVIDAANDAVIRRAGVVRTARLIFRGDALVPADVWSGP